MRMPNTVRVRVEQAGGKYGRFECPKCGHPAMYKFTASVGDCDGCGAYWFAALETATDFYDAKKSIKSTHWITLEEGN